jgi:hypothetical protein
VLDALEQALWARKPTQGGLIHHSDRGVQYVSIRYSERLAQAGIEPSVGSVGDSYTCQLRRAAPPENRHAGVVGTERHRILRL